MREPTGAICASFVSEDYPGRTWQAMIDAILAEDET
jgi:hypothetical protein